MIQFYAVKPALQHTVYKVSRFMSRTLRCRYLVAIIACSWLLTAGCDSTLRRDSVSPASSSDSGESAPVDSPEQLIGKRPPSLHVAKWVKGEPLAEFEHGKIYVVDFWATWCGPCIAAIPHLTKLAQEHQGKLEVIGVSISEQQKSPTDTAYIEKVAQFVEKRGDRMDYRVAVDTPDKQMHRTWFEPTGTGGIPTAYIIDQNGLVAWTGIGDPTVIERIVHELLEGKHDPGNEAERQKLQAEEAEANAKLAAKSAKGFTSKIYEAFPGYEDAMKNGDSAAALAILNEAFAKDPALEPKGAHQWKLNLLMQRNKSDEVNTYLKELLEKYPTNGDVIGFASACAVSTSEEARFDKQLSFEVAKKSVELNDPESRFGQFAKWRLGWAYYHIGDREKAIESVRGALDGIKRLKGTVDFGDLEIQCEDSLKVFAAPANKQ